MPLITWGPRLETGLAIIDSQHKRLVDIINQLNDALEAGREKLTRDEVIALVALALANSDS